MGASFDTSTRSALRMSGTYYADPAGLALCLRNAGIGQSFVYAKGPATDPAHPVVKLVSAEVAAGRATVNVQRSKTGDDGGGELRYLIRKLAVKFEPVALAPAPAAKLHPLAQDLYDLLVAAAEARRPCPSNDALAELLGVADRYRARHRFDQLVKAGLIKVIEPNRYGTRVIEITATGQRTAAAAAKEARTGRAVQALRQAQGERSFEK